MALSNDIRKPTITVGAVVVLPTPVNNQQEVASGTRRAIARFCANDRDTNVCDCVGAHLKLTAERHADEVIFPREWLKHDLRSAYSPSAAVALQIMLDRWDRAYQAKLKSMPGHDTPNSLCTVCNGTGVLPRLFNGKDITAYQIGGIRYGWNKYISPHDFEVNDDFGASTLRDNSRSLLDFKAFWEPDSYRYSFFTETQLRLHQCLGTSGVIITTRPSRNLSISDQLRRRQLSYEFNFDAFQNKTKDFFRAFPDQRDTTLVCVTLYFSAIRYVRHRREFINLLNSGCATMLEDAE